jgi:hypothetical protein
MQNLPDLLLLRLVICSSDGDTNSICSFSSFSLTSSILCRVSAFLDNILRPWGSEWRRPRFQKWSSLRDTGGILFMSPIISWIDWTAWSFFCLDSKEFIDFLRCFWLSTERVADGRRPLWCSVSFFASPFPAVVSLTASGCYEEISIMNIKNVSCHLHEKRLLDQVAWSKNLERKDTPRRHAIFWAECLNSHSKSMSEQRTKRVNADKKERKKNDVNFFFHMYNSQWMVSKEKVLLGKGKMPSMIIW